MKCLLGQNARIGGVKPETLWAMERAKEVMWDKGHAIVFTSIMDRKLPYSIRLSSTITIMA